MIVVARGSVPTLAWGGSSTPEGGCDYPYSVVGGPEGCEPSLEAWHSSPAAKTPDRASPARSASRPHPCVPVPRSARSELGPLLRADPGPDTVRAHQVLLAHNRAH